MGVYMRERERKKEERNGQLIRLHVRQIERMDFLSSKDLFQWGII